MKTTNNVRKAILKSAAVIASLVLISFTVNAQNFWKSLLEKETFSQFAIAMLENNSESNSASNKGSNYTDADAFAAYTKIETEEVLQVEVWMMTESNFSTVPFIETESESPMEIESWMTNESLFNAYSAYLEIETEEALLLEDWMTNDNIFNSPSSVFTVETESAMEIQNWMFNEKLFTTTESVERPLEVEDWMISELTWK